MQVGGCRLAAVGCTLTYGATTSATGRAVDVAAEVTAERVAYYEAGGTLQGLLNCLLPAGAALTQLTLQKYSSASAAELASLRAPALSELEALTLQACAATSLLSLCESSPHLTRLSASGFNHYSRPNAVSAAMAALPLRQVQLHGVNLPDLPAGRWLEGAALSSVRLQEALKWAAMHGAWDGFCMLFARENHSCAQECLTCTACCRAGGAFYHLSAPPAYGSGGNRCAPAGT